jgi:NAD(P)-dependent dehydrogenase (short-subunit alcohol dehydrogenase family)
VVNCAGIGLAARIVGREGKLSVDLFERVIRVNLIGTYNVMSYAAQAMMELPPLETTERGVIVNTSSAAWEDGQIGQSAYAASKGAIAAMCLPAAREFARAGIRVMAVAPGLFHTPMMEGLPPETTEAITANIPFPARLGDPAEFGLMVGQIVENPYLNGTVIRLDGAVRLPPR